jgi:hypothetical protein
VGTGVGKVVGVGVGTGVGKVVGVGVGTGGGICVGILVGETVGIKVGKCVGTLVGGKVGKLLCIKNKINNVINVINTGKLIIIHFSLFVHDFCSTCS